MTGGERVALITALRLFSHRVDQRCCVRDMTSLVIGPTGADDDDDDDGLKVVCVNFAHFAHYSH